MELAQDWRTDKMLRQLEALLIVADQTTLSSDLRHRRPDLARGRDLAVGSGGPYALAAAPALSEAPRRPLRRRHRPQSDRLLTRARTIAKSSRTPTTDRH
jgi:ATP-dependent HslUV protease subunit HslV